MAHVVYTGLADEAGARGQMFQGKKFWLAQKVPSRTRFIEEVKANGGEVVPLEKLADIKIVDHARKERIPGTFSYKYIEASVRNGVLEDLDQHAVGPAEGTVREAGSTIQPSKSGRTPFSEEDDRVLVKWVLDTERNGGSTKGNEIYKQLEMKNPRHTWQSWRDRWVKTLRFRSRSASIFHHASPSPASKNGVAAVSPSAELEPEKGSRPAKTSTPINEAGITTRPESPTYHPESPTRHSPPSGPSKIVLTPTNHQRDGSEEALPVRTYPQQGSPTYQDRGEERHRSPGKRKRKSSPENDVEVPSSSPPEFPKSTKRLRTDFADPLVEIATTPERNPTRFEAREIPDTIPPDILAPGTPRSVDLVDLSAADRSTEPSDEEIEREERSVSPELGRSPTRSPKSSRRIVSETQTAFEEPLPLTDFDLAEPEGGWDDEQDENEVAVDSLAEKPVIVEDNDSKVDSQDDEDLEEEVPTEGHDQDKKVKGPKRRPPHPQPATQAIFSAETQDPDLSLADPEGGWAAFEGAEQSPAPAPPSEPDIQSLVDQQLLAESQRTSPPPTPRTRQKSPTPDYAQQVEGFITYHISLGHSEDSILLALKAANMDPALSSQALKAMKKSGGSEIPGDMKGVWTEEDDADWESGDARKVARVEKKHGSAGVEARFEFLKEYRRD
ncbi:MAG: hypothetical protein Q9174_000823 [Haloplaca sp. 1 TL-2023]